MTITDEKNKPIEYLLFTAENSLKSDILRNTLKEHSIPFTESVEHLPSLIKSLPLLFCAGSSKLESYGDAMDRIQLEALVGLPKQPKLFNIEEEVKDE